ncbi:MAG TPA: hypothetical protein VF571_11835 [Pyrinomonadaceae bacterium]
MNVFSAAFFLLAFFFACKSETIESVNFKLTSNNQTINNQINKTNEQANLQPPPQEKRANAAKDNFEGTAGIVKKDYRLKENSVLKNFRAARHKNYDRIVFEFQTAEMPGYKIEYVDDVQQCGSGNAVSLAGDAQLEITFTPAQAHNNKGRPTVKKREQKFGYKILKEAKITCDFEGDVTVALGVSAPNKYQVLELKNPTRLAIDIKH